MIFAIRRPLALNLAPASGGEGIHIGICVERQRGLTLIEVMVALTIFALLSGVAYRGLGAVLDARERVDRETRKWREVTLAFVNIQQSLTSAVDRPVREGSGSVAAAFVAPASIRAGEPQLAFTRMGFPGHRGVLADLQRVGYRLKGDAIEQLIWPVLDQAPGTEPLASKILGNVAGVKLRYLARNGTWRMSWPAIGDDAVMPAALELTLTLTSGEQITRLFALP